MLLTDHGDFSYASGAGVLEAPFSMTSIVTLESLNLESVAGFSPLVADIVDICA